MVDKERLGVKAFIHMPSGNIEIPLQPNRSYLCLIQPSQMDLPQVPKGSIKTVEEMAGLGSFETSEGVIKAITARFGWVLSKVSNRLLVYRQDNMMGPIVPYKSAQVNRSFKEFYVFTRADLEINTGMYIRNEFKLDHDPLYWPKKLK